MHSLYSTRCLTGSQWRSCSRENEWSRRDEPATKVQLCWALTVVAGCRRLEDRRKQRYSSPAGCEPEQLRERLARVKIETAWLICSVCCTTTVREWCESSLSRRRRRRHRGLWLTAPDELSPGRLVRLHWECDGDGVQERTKCLLCVQLQHVAARPPRNVMDALRHVGLERAGVGRWGPAVNLGVVRVQVGRQRVVGCCWLQVVAELNCFKVCIDNAFQK